MKYERVHPCHSPCLLRCAWTVSGTPRCHSPVVDFTQHSEGYARLFCNVRQSCDAWILCVESRRIRRRTFLRPLVRGKRTVRLRVLPRHFCSSRNLTVPPRLATRRQSPVVFQRPQHYILSLKTRSNTMAHGPNTAEVLQRIAAITAGRVHLDLRNLRITSLPPLPPTLRTFVCDDNKLTELPALPPGLIELRCSGNQLIQLPALPPGLLRFSCRSNRLARLPALPPTLEELDCSYSRIDTLPDLPPTLTLLRCTYNRLAVLPALPNNLTRLDCAENSLTQLPNLPRRLIHLMCSNNQLTVLPALPDTLELLHCFRNQLTAMPDLPDSLEILSCGVNRLTAFPVINPSISLEILMCDENQLTALPNLDGTNLRFLYCSDNQVTVLPTLPGSLRVLVCKNNRLTVLPGLPPSIEELGCDNNPISRVMFPFPPSIKDRLMQNVFAGTHLQFLPDETLEMYQERMMAHRSNSGGVSASPLVSAVYVAPPRGPGNAIPGGPGYQALATQYPGPDGAPGQKKLGGRRTKRTRRSKRTRSLKKRFRGK